METNFGGFADGLGRSLVIFCVHVETYVEVDRFPEYFLEKGVVKTDEEVAEGELFAVNLLDEAPHLFVVVKRVVVAVELLAEVLFESEEAGFEAKQVYEDLDFHGSHPVADEVDVVPAFLEIEVATHFLVVVFYSQEGYYVVLFEFEFFLEAGGGVDNLFDEFLDKLVVLLLDVLEDVCDLA